MSFTAGDVVNAARDLHPSFDPKSSPDEVAWRFLQRFARALASDVVQARPEALTPTPLVTSLPLATFANGITIPAHLLVLEVTTLRQGGTSPTDDIPVSLLSAAQHLRFTGNGSIAFGNATLTAYLTGSVLQLGGDAVSWSPYASVTTRYIPMPTVTGSASVLALPDDAATPCISALADFFSQRRQGMTDAAPSGLYARTAADDRATFLDRVMRQAGVEEIRVQDVYGDRGGW
jgi:hypothetical protein